ncbi:hypothetical protein CPB84DRAFT_1845378 [Gymnopilus junonius]|uniref:Uncharacterized protein n=1 Tax=Gymnopilus junonius TaxID=109634 RepID=A0A9P5NTA1_GYMJU|nr:hypothetical protein CPB84DRAFT_1845378 [Gymnopilus junonius]
MNHSTTGTFTYVLSKYSRSYPAKRANQNSQTQTRTGSELSSDWQHFTNPIIHLVLDVESTSNGEIRSVRLRILWQLNVDLDTAYNQADMVFARRFRSSFFSATLSNTPRKNQAEGLPLKAVYRDSVVGIRYLHSREDSTTPVYRRFQVSFQNPSEASDFVEIIKPVCPCKLNPTSVPPALVPEGLPQSRFAAKKHAPVLATSGSVFQGRGSSYGFQAPSFPAFAKQNSSRLQSTHTAANEAFTKSLTFSSSPSGYQAPSNTLSYDSLNNSLNNLQNPMQRTLSLFPTIPTTQIAATPVETPTTAFGIPSNIPSSSLPSLSSSAPDKPSFLLKDTSGSNLQKESVCGLSPSFDDASSIYNMPNSALEQVVGEIVHEDGFVQLLERMSELLTVRTLLNST